MTYLTQALQRRELFAWLQLQPQVWWHTLLFRDPYNWGGMAADEAVAQLQVRGRLGCDRAGRQLK